MPRDKSKGDAPAAEPDSRRRIAQGLGTWRLLTSPSELLVALRDKADGAIADLSELNPANAVLAGDLGEMQPSDLLNFLHQGRRTGVLLTRSDGIERGIVLLDGNVAWACSTSTGERLGELLVRMGLADRSRVEAALADQVDAPDPRRIGQHLIGAGVLDEAELSRGLHHQVVEIFLGLLVARTGSFIFLRGVERSKLPATLELDTQGMLLDGLRRLDEMELYRTRIPSAEVRPRATGKVPREENAVTPEAKQVLALLDGRRTLAEVAALTAVGEFEAIKAAYALLVAGAIELE